MNLEQRGEITPSHNAQLTFMRFNRDGLSRAIHTLATSRVYMLYVELSLKNAVSAEYSCKVNIYNQCVNNDTDPQSISKLNSKWWCFHYKA